MTDNCLPIIESCNNCGACCLEQESPPGYLSILCHGHKAAFSREDAERFAQIPADALREFHDYAKHMRNVGEHPNNGVCIWFDELTRKCKHYDLRPEICREEIAAGDEACRLWRDRFGVTV